MSLRSVAQRVGRLCGRCGSFCTPALHSARFRAAAVVLLWFINGVLSLASRAPLSFDLAAAIAHSLKHEYVTPGSEVGGEEVRAAVLTCGVYALLAALVGAFAVLRASHRAASIFLTLLALNFGISAAAMLVSCFAAAISASLLLAALPAAWLALHFMRAVHAYRAQLLLGAGTGGAGTDMRHAAPQPDTEGGALEVEGEHIDVADLRLPASQPAKARAPTLRIAGGSSVPTLAPPRGVVPAGSFSIALDEEEDDEDEDNDLGRSRHARV